MVRCGIAVKSPCWSSVGWCRAGPILLSVTLLVLGAVPLRAEEAVPPVSSESTPARVNVWVDLSHSFGNGCYQLPDGLIPAAGLGGTASMASLPLEIPVGYQVLVISGGGGCVDFSGAEVHVIREFVRRGGGLFLGGNPAQDMWYGSPDVPPGEAVTPEYPIGKLAREFGFDFIRREVSGPFGLLPHPITEGVENFENVVPYPAQELLILEPADGILVAPDGKVIMAIRSFGDGRVVACSHPDLLFVPKSSTRVEYANIPFIRQLFEWLGAHAGPPEPAIAVPKRVEAENRVTVGSLEVVYPSTIPETIRRQVLASVIWAYWGLRDVTGLPKSSHARVSLIASRGAIGHAPSAEFEIGFLSQPSQLVETVVFMGIGWELYMAKLPEVAKRALEFCVTAQIGEHFPVPGGTRCGWDDVNRRLNNADPDRTEIGIHDPMGRQDWEILDKACWLLHSIERAYGADIWRRFFDRYLEEYKKAGQPVSLEEFVDDLSTVAGEDLRSFFRATGTKLGKEPCP